MFLTLLKLKQEAESSDRQGLIKQANKADDRIQRISRFLSSMHTLDLPDYLVERLEEARKAYDIYMLKQAARRGYEDDDFGGSVGTENDLFSDSPKRSSSGLKMPQGYRNPVDFSHSYLALMTGGDTSDKRYFLNLTPAPITDEDGKLLSSARVENPEGVIIYLIAHPEEQRNPENEKYQKYIAGDYSKISREQAKQILDFYGANPFNREAFPKMCLDLFGQLMMKAGKSRDENGKVSDKPVQVKDPVINGLNPEFARMEIFGRDVDSDIPAEQGNPFAENGGRFAPILNYIGKNLSRESAAAMDAVFGFWKKESKQKAVEEAVKSGNFSNLFNYIERAAKAGQSKKQEHGEKEKVNYPQVMDNERRLLGGDTFGLALLKNLREIAGEFAVSIDSNTLKLPKELMAALYKRWDFSDLQHSPFASLADNRVVANKFNKPREQNKLILEVIAEEEKNKKLGKEYVPFFTENPPDLVTRTIGNLGMLTRFEEFSLNASNEINLIRVRGRLMAKLKQNKKYIADLESGKQPDGELQDTREEEDLIMKYGEDPYTLNIDPETGELSLRPDPLAKIELNILKRKEIIKEVGRELGENGGKEQMNRKAVDQAADIALRYARPFSKVSLDQPVGSEGEGTTLEHFIGDETSLTPEEIMMLKEEGGEEAASSKKEKELAKLNEQLFDAKALAMFVYLGRSSRVAPRFLGFRKAFESGIESEFDKYMAIVKDMMKRHGGFESQDTDEEQDVLDDDIVKDEEWEKNIEKQYGKKVRFYDINKDGTTTVTFDDARSITIRNDQPQPRSKKQIIKDMQNSVEQQESMIKGRGSVEFRIKAADWMRNFDVDKVIEMDDVLTFNKEDPMGSRKRETEPRIVARSVIMDDEFHNKFVEYLKSETAKNSHWSYDMGIAAKSGPATKPYGGIPQSEKTFRLGRLLAYMYYICGVETTQFGPLTMEMNVRDIFGSYVDIVSRYYDQFKSQDSDVDADAIALNMKIPTKVVGQGENKEYNRGDSAIELVTNITNKKDSNDIDNIVYLASQFFDLSTAVPAVMVGKQRSARTSEVNLGLSTQRAKAFYLMRLKYIFDGLRVGGIGVDEAHAKIKRVERIGDTLFSATLAFGDVRMRLFRAVSGVQSIIKGVEKQLKDSQTQNPEEISAIAREALTAVARQEEGFEKTYKETAEQNKLIIDFEKDLQHFLRFYKINGKPIAPLTLQDAPEIYANYMDYVKRRYGSESGEFNPEYIQELVDKFSSLDSEDEPEATLGISREIKDIREDFYEKAREARYTLDDMVAKGENPYLDMEQGKTTETEVPAEPVAVSPEEARDVPASPAATPIAPAQAPAAVAPQGKDQRMEQIRDMWTNYKFKSVPKDSDEYRTLQSLGFVLSDSNSPNMAWVSKMPTDFYEYERNRAFRERMQRRKAGSDLDNMIVIGEKEIDYILYVYGV